MTLNSITGSAQTTEWPNSRIEAWKYTDLNQLVSNMPLSNGSPSIPLWQVEPHDLQSLFTELESPEAILRELDGFSRLVHAAGRGGWLAHIPAGTSSNFPVRLTYTPSSNAGWSGYTHQIQVAEGARITLIEEFEEDESPENLSVKNEPLEAYSTPVLSMTLHHLQVNLARGAELKLIRLFHCPMSKALVHQIDAQQEEGSNLEVQTVVMGSGIIRNNIHIQQLGDRCSSNLLGLSVAIGGGHLDQYSRIRHNALEGNSHQHYKAIAAPNSTTIFNGVLRVEPNAQQTNAYQRSSNLMLDPASLSRVNGSSPSIRSGKVNAKPELQIFADNVKCSHGATMGKLNTDSIFYLQSRGLTFEEAQKILTLAFAMEIVDQLEDERMRAKVISILDLKQWQ